MYPGPRLIINHKSDPIIQWSLTDRVFFACGACHILAYAFLERFENDNAKAIWIKPNEGYRGNHIFVKTDKFIFDYHGYSTENAFIHHLFRRAKHYWPGWNCDFIELPMDVLISEQKSKTYDGLWLREPTQFLHNALPRAYKFLEHFN